MRVRNATSDDGPAACEVMRRSIAELCVADHRNDPAILARWLSNKTPEIFCEWIRRGNSLMVAVKHERILAVGCVTDAGEITLNYVSPKSLLEALERRAIELGNNRFQLESTETARRFYLARGYIERGPAGRKFGASSGYPMSKIVRASTG
jgi:hypothetical protein